MTHYETLKIENGASADEIKRAYYKLVRQFPPERFPDEFRSVREAYDTLSNGALRGKYDLQLETHGRIVGGLPADTVARMDDIRSEIQRAHTGKAVKAAETLYGQYPGNYAVMSLLADAYLARGWKNKAENLLLSPEYYNTLRTASDWCKYTVVLESLEDIPHEEIFVKNMYGISALSKTGEDNIDMCASAYADFSALPDVFSEFLNLPEEFNTPDKLLNHVLQLSKRGLKTDDGEFLFSRLVMPVVQYKKPSELKNDDIKRLQIISEILRNAVNPSDLKKPHFSELLEGIEYIVYENLNPPTRNEPVRAGVKIGRNELCPCGSGKKYKKCCGR